MPIAPPARTPRLCSATVVFIALLAILPGCQTSTTPTSPPTNGQAAMRIAPAVVETFVPAEFATTKNNESASATHAEPDLSASTEATEPSAESVIALTSEPTAERAAELITEPILPPPAPSSKLLAELPKRTPFLGVGYHVIALPATLTTTLTAARTTHTDTNTDTASHALTGPLTHAYTINLVMPGSAAATAGLRPNDVIWAWDGQSLVGVSTKNRQAALATYISEAKNINDTLTLDAVRFNTALTIGDKMLINNDIRPELNVLLNHPNYAISHDVRIAHTVEPMRITAILGSRTADVALPNNATFYPEDAFLDDPLHDLPRALMALTSTETQAAHVDLITRFEEDERWDAPLDLGKRLPRIRYLRRAPHRLLAVSDAESAKWLANKEDDHQDNQDHHANLATRLIDASNWLAIRFTPPSAPALPTRATTANITAFITQQLARAARAETRALAALTSTEQTALETGLPALVGQFADSYYIQGADDAANQEHRATLAVLAKLNISAYLTAAHHLAALYEPRFLALIRAANSMLDKTTPYGRIVVAGAGDDLHTTSAAVYIDLGGDDRYLGKAAQSKMVIDMNGNDRYESSTNGSMASAWLGANVWADMAGDDIYRGARFSQAVAVAGVAILHDMAGNDTYVAQRFGQGAALWGVAMLMDDAGDDTYTAWRYAQGMGGPTGFGVLNDGAGHDTYQATGETMSSYGSANNFRASSQGFGAGFRGLASGGVGFLVDASGNDTYDAGNFAQGVGYFFGMGLLRDGGGDDVYSAARYGLGASAHSAIGIAIDDAGDDVYSGNGVALLGAAWDISLAGFWDKAGNDRYRKHPVGFSIGAAAHNGYSLFLDSGGADRYQQKGRRVPANDYHDGASFALFVDAGGDTDDYDGENDGNNQYQVLDTSPNRTALILDMPEPLKPNRAAIIHRTLQAATPKARQTTSATDTITYLEW